MSIDFDTPGSEIDQSDWLGEDLEPEDPTGGDDGGGGGRLFLILAIGLAGLIILGLVAVGGLLYFRRARDAQTIVQITPATPTVQLDEVVPTPTFTPTPMPPTVTSQPTIAPTNTRVVQGDPNAVVGGSNGNGEQAGAGNGGSGNDNGATGSNGSSNGSTGGTGNNSPPSKAPTAIPVPPSGATEVPNTGFGGLELGLIAGGLVLVLLVTRRLRHVN